MAVQQVEALLLVLLVAANVLAIQPANTPTTPTQPATESSTEEPEAVDPFLEDLCIIENSTEAYRVNTEWTEEACDQKCRCVFRSTPLDDTREVLLLKTINMNSSSELTEIRCSMPPKCGPLEGRLHQASRCARPLLAFTNGEPCSCPKLYCSDIHFIGMKPSTQIVVSSTTSEGPTTTANILAVSTTKPVPTSPILTNATPTIATPTTATPTTATPTTTTPTTTPQTTTVLATTVPSTTTTTTDTTTSTFNLIGNSIDQPTVAASVAATVGPHIQKYAWHLLVGFVTMSIMFIIVLFMYIKKSTFVMTTLAAQTGYDNASYNSRLVSYFASQPHILLLDETNQNFNNAAIIARQKNLEVDQTSPLHLQTSR